jgi:hypothetical protein
MGSWYPLRRTRARTYCQAEEHTTPEYITLDLLTTDLVDRFLVWLATT